MGENYGSNMGNAFYKMYQKLKKSGIEPEFLGWSVNEEMIKFIDDWMPKYEKLSKNARKAATFKFLGVEPGRGVRTTDSDGNPITISNVHQLPPISGEKDGITLLDPDIMEEYFDIYNEIFTYPIY